MKYGYARVSSKAQDHAAQIEALKAAGCERIYREKMSGKSTDGRREFDKLMKALTPGDTVPSLTAWRGLVGTCTTSCTSCKRSAVASYPLEKAGATPPATLACW
jgi:hypothetical protein